MGNRNAFDRRILSSGFVIRNTSQIKYTVHEEVQRIKNLLRNHSQTVRRVCLFIFFFFVFLSRIRLWFRTGGHRAVWMFADRCDDDNNYRWRVKRPSAGQMPEAPGGEGGMGESRVEKAKISWPDERACTTVIQIDENRKKRNLFAKI